MRNNFDVLIRILDAPMSYVGGAAATDDDDVSSVLTEDERFRLREVITHDVQIKKFLQVKIPIWIQLSLSKSELKELELSFIITFFNVIELLTEMNMTP